MELSLDTVAGQAADALLAGVTDPAAPPATATALTVDEQAAVKTSVHTLLAQAGITDATLPVEVHFAASPEGGWAVLRVAYVQRAV